MNKIIITGRLTATPENKMTQSGTSVTDFTLAVDRPYQKGAEKQTDFVNCQAWRSTADFICKHFVKGKQMLAEGRLQNDRWTDKEGNNRDRWRVVVENVEFIGSREEPKAEPEAQFVDIQNDDDLPF